MSALQNTTERTIILSQDMSNFYPSPLSECSYLADDTFPSLPYLESCLFSTDHYELFPSPERLSPLLLFDDEPVDPASLATPFVEILRSLELNYEYLLPSEINECLLVSRTDVPWYGNDMSKLYMRHIIVATDFVVEVRCCSPNVVCMILDYLDLSSVTLFGMTCRQARSLVQTYLRGRFQRTVMRFNLDAHGLFLALDQCQAIIYGDRALLTIKPAAWSYDFQPQFLEFSVSENNSVAFVERILNLGEFTVSSECVIYDGSTSPTQKIWNIVHESNPSLISIRVISSFSNHRFKPIFYAPSTLAFNHISSSGIISF